MTKYNKEFFDRQKDASYISASIIVPIVMEYVSPKSVVDVGCGVGVHGFRSLRSKGLEIFLV